MSAVPPKAHMTNTIKFLAEFELVNLPYSALVPRLGHCPGEMGLGGAGGGLIPVYCADS